RQAKWQVWIHAGDAEMLTNPSLNLSVWIGAPIQLPPADRLLADGDTIWLDNILLTVRHTPGHTRGGICLVGPNLVFTGDTLFCGSVGRTDFPGGNMNELINGIRRHLLVLDDNYRVFPGHGPQSTIGRERLSNPFLQGAADDPC
ncbi:MAG: MBL fold metallo-hydrolase, partial [Bacillota bacterium]